MLFHAGTVQEMYHYLIVRTDSGVNELSGALLIVVIVLRKRYEQSTLYRQCKTVVHWFTSH